MAKTYSQTCVQRPPLGPEKHGPYAEGCLKKLASYWPLWLQTGRCWQVAVVQRWSLGQVWLFWNFVYRLMGSQIMLLQWKPLNVITLGQTQTDNINRMITISELLKIWKSSFLVTIFNHLGVRKEQRDNKCAWVLIKLQWLFADYLHC